MADISAKKIVIDLDDTISKTIDGNYKESLPIVPVVERLKEYKAKGYQIVIYSSRNMRSYECNMGKINANTLPVIIDFLNKYGVPYDEIFVGKPWCGKGGFYVDDRALRPTEFLGFSEDEIQELLKKEKDKIDTLCLNPELLTK